MADKTSSTDIVMGNVAPLKQRIAELEEEVKTLKLRLAGFDDPNLGSVLIALDKTTRVNARLNGWDRQREAARNPDVNKD